MGTCPNCGNWVDEGDVCGVCGGSSSYSSDNKDEEIHYSNPRNDKISSHYAYRDFAYQDAMKSFNKKDYKSTLSTCDRYLKYEARKFEFLLLKAKSLFELKRYGECIDCCEYSIEHHLKYTKNHLEKNFYKTNGHEFWQLKGDCLLKLNRINSSIDSIEEGLKLINKTFDKDYLRYYYIEEVQTEKYQALANLVASKLIALQISGKSDEAQDLFKEYAFIKIMDYPIFLGDDDSKEEYKLYPLIRNSFRKKKLKFSFHVIQFPEKIVYCNNCGRKINYVEYIENKKVCPGCRKRNFFSNSEEECEDLLKKKQERLERERREKKLREKDPVYLKNEIEKQKSVFKTSRLLLRLETFQKDSENKFYKILRLEKLLEKCDVEIDYDLKQLKKENKRLKYCIEHFEDQYTYNAKRLLEKNIEKISTIEKEKEEERIIIKITD